MEYNFLRFRLFYFQAFKLNSTQRKINKLGDKKYIGLRVLFRSGQSLRFLGVVLVLIIFYINDNK